MKSRQRTALSALLLAALVTASAGTAVASIGGPRAPRSPASAASAASRLSVVVTVQNLAPLSGTFQTPVWVGFHDGSFDSYDGGTAASTLPTPGSDAIERIAEDGTVGPLNADFAALVPSGVQGVITSNGAIPPFGPGQVASRLFEVDADVNRYFSYVSMVIPSNDAFIANGSSVAHEIFDADGIFVADAFVVAGDETNDAGTEVNDEIPANTAFFGQMAPDTGVDEGGLIVAHPGFNAPGSGGILDDPMFADADFLADGYNLLRFSFQFFDKGRRQRFEGRLSADQEVHDPDVERGARGDGRFELVDDGETINFRVRYRNLTGPLTAAHLHLAPVGANGPVVVDLLASGTDDGREIEGVITLADVLGPLGATPEPLDSLIAELVSGTIYVNLHTAMNPMGELRGQQCLR